MAYIETSQMPLVMAVAHSYTTWGIFFSFSSCKGRSMIRENQSSDLSPIITKAAVAVQRVGYVDIAKGIGIILVVMGHNDFALISPFAHKFIYSFHMPMFFFMSGMFLKTDLPLWNFLKNRFHRVLKPFLAILLLIYFGSLSFSKVSMVVASRRLLKAMYGSGHYIDWVHLWFLPHLFAVSLFAYLFFKAVKKTHLEPYRWLILAVLYVAGVFAMKLFWPLNISVLGRNVTLFGLPYGLDMVLVSGFFFILGYELNKRRNDAWFAHPWTFVLTGLGLLFLVWYFPARIDFNTRQFDSLWINTLEALTGIFFILALSWQLERVGWLRLYRSGVPHHPDLPGSHSGLLGSKAPGSDEQSHVLVLAFFFGWGNWTNPDWCIPDPSQSNCP
jgi:polysaccharide biosynthesis protein PslL